MKELVKVVMMSFLLIITTVNASAALIEFESTSFSNLLTEQQLVCEGDCSRPIMRTSFFDIDPIPPYTSFLSLRTGSSGPGAFVSVYKDVVLTPGTLGVWHIVTRLEESGSSHIDLATITAQRMDAGTPVEDPIVVLLYSTAQPNFVSWQFAEAEILKSGTYRIRATILHEVGELTPSKVTSFSLQEMVFTPRAVPAPASLLLLGSAVAGLAIFLRRT